MWALWIALQISGPAHGWTQVDADVRRIHDDSSSASERLTKISALFVGAPYQLSPLGEGAGQDPDPIARFDRFDCVTYVEEVMALTRHRDLLAAVADLQQIRYSGGEIAYGKRRHIMMAQWIPENITAGRVRDVTRQVAGSQATHATLFLDAEDYETDEGKALALQTADRPTGRFGLPIVPIDAAGWIERVPHGTILTTIREDRPGVPYRATHVGLVIVANGQRLIRHADKGRGRVVQEELSAFVTRRRKRQRRPVTGFHLLALNP